MICPAILDPVCGYAVRYRVVIPGAGRVNTGENILYRMPGFSAVFGGLFSHGGKLSCELGKSFQNSTNVREGSSDGVSFAHNVHQHLSG